MCQLFRIFSESDRILHYIPKKEIVILRHNYSEDQCRKRSIRKRARKSPHSLLTKQCLNNISVKFQREIMNSNDNLSEDDSNISITNNDVDIIGSKIMFQKDQTKNIIECPEKNEEELENTNKKSEDDKTMIRSLEIAPDQKLPLSNKGVLSKKIEKSSQRFSFANDGESLEEKCKDFECISSNANQHRKSSLLNQMKNNLNLDGILELLIENIKTNKFPDKNRFLNIHDKVQGHFLEDNLEIDLMKSYDDYFPYDNIELVLARVSEKKMLKCRKSRIINRTKMLEWKNNGESSPRKNFEHSNSPFQRKFFKNEENLEKLIQEEKFDRHRFKERFLENIEKDKKKKSGFLNIANFFVERNGKKTVLRVKKRKKSFGESLKPEK